MEDESGDIWIATYGYGICRLNTQTGKFVHYPSLAPLNRANHLFQDRDKNLWVCLWGDGVVKIENKNDSYHPIYTHLQKESTYECIFRSLQQLDNGEIIAGTNQGLYSITPDNILQSLNKQDNTLYTQILNNEINYLYTDKEHNVWIATQKLRRLCRIPREKIHSQIIH